MTAQGDIRVLIAEDDYLVSEDIARCLTKQGYVHIGTASNGEKAVQMAQELTPDVILMDIQMPKMDGLQAAAEISRICPVPIVILTANENRELIEQASASGVAAYLVKPPERSEIDRAILIAMARHADLMELRRLNEELRQQKQELQEAYDHIDTLSGLIPICSYCKKIRDDQGYWQQVEKYIKDHSKAQFTHGVCPDCIKLHYPELADKLGKLD